MGHEVQALINKISAKYKLLWLVTVFHSYQTKTSIDKIDIVKEYSFIAPKTVVTYNSLV